MAPPQSNSGCSGCTADGCSGLSTLKFDDWIKGMHHGPSLAVVTFNVIDTSGVNRNKIYYEWGRHQSLARANARRLGNCLFSANVCSIARTPPRRSESVRQRGHVRPVRTEQHRWKTVQPQVRAIITKLLGYERHPDMKGTQITAAWQRTSYEHHLTTTPLCVSGQLGRDIIYFLLRWQASARIETC